MPQTVSRAEFVAAAEAVWQEIEYQNNLPRRTADEAKDVAGFLTLGRTYLRRTEDAWAGNAGVEQADGRVQVPEALHGLRKLSAIFLRAMIYNGILTRQRG